MKVDEPRRYTKSAGYYGQFQDVVKSVGKFNRY